MKLVRTWAYILAALLLYLLVIGMTNQLWAQLPIPKEITLMGKTLSLSDALASVVYALVAAAIALALDVLIFGYHASSMKRLLAAQSPSVRLDLWAFFFKQSRIMTIFTMLFTLGLYVLIDRFVGAHSQFNLYSKIAAVSPVLAFSVFLVVFTYFDYWNHRLQHAKYLWALHRFHHSAREMSHITAYRNHPAQEILSPLTRTLPLALFGLPIEVAFYFFALNAFYQLIVHTNSDWSWGWFGRYVLLSPYHHKIHHSCVIEHYDRNYGIVAVWDRLHGTYFDDAGLPVVELGVRDPDYTSSNLPKVLIRDFKDFILLPLRPRS